ncbi:hypothetical protein LPJ64_005880 [Coemansia asiatica]|uniref:Uncharacterized protein n=1 Tax=Coemansia asiatica TaxID=1052880 RepID=A0A9W7XG71_9FUNG|nr:hypothetical protein LPJ64_005880 [Coemansia asiatica]
MRFGSCKWSSVKKFQTHVDFSPANREFNEMRYQVRGVSHTALSHLLAGFLRENMPQIKTLIVNDVSDSSLSREANSAIIDCFLPQLTMLQSESAVTFTNQLAANLNSIRVRIGPSRLNILPGLVPEQLTLIELAGVPKAFNWSYFDRSEQQSGEINFANLLSLKLIFNGQENNHDARLGTHKVVFPKLEKLAIVGWFQNFSLFEAAVFPAHLQRLEFSECLDAMVEITNTQTIQTTDSLAISIMQRVPEHLFYQITNYYFGANNPSTFNELYIGFHTFSHMPLDDLNWHSLLFLQLNNTIGFDQTLALLARCPKLKELSISNMSFDETDAEFIVLPPDLSVKKIILLSSYRYDMIEYIQKCIRHLVIGLKQLSYLITNIDVFEFLKNLIIKEKSAYTHLKNLVLNEGDLF